MLKKIVALFLCIICTTTFANTKNEFKNAVHSLNYGLTVEWDQKSKSAFDAIMSDFLFQVSKLRQNGLSNREIKESLLEMVQNPSLRSQLEFQASLINFSEDDHIGKLVWNKKDSFYSHGASWNGSVVVQVVLWSVLATIMASVIYYGILHPMDFQCTEYGEYKCETKWGCDYTDSDGNCSSYSDYESCGSPCINGYEYRR